MQSWIRGVFFSSLLVTCCFVLQVPTSHAQRFDSQGFNYFREPAPAWFVNEAPARETPRARSFWHYVSIMHQTKLGVNTAAASTRIVRRINDASGLTEAARVEALFDPTYQRLVFHELSILRNGAKLDAMKPSAISLLRRETR